MGATVNELMTQVTKCGAKLRIKDGHLERVGEIPNVLKAQLREHREELVKELTWDQERAYTMLREALVYVNEVRIKAGPLWEKAECDEDPVLQYVINEAFANEDMWAFRVARKLWVMAWVKAIAEVKGGVAA